MSIRLSTELRLPPGDRSCLKRMIARSRAGGALTVRLRIDPLSPPVFDDVLERGDTSRVFMLAELDEEADHILLVLRERESDDASRTRRRRRIGAITYPGALAIAINEETGGVVVRSLPDTKARLVH